MASITVKDLPDSIELDQQAMSNILGGTRSAAGRQGRALATAGQGPKTVRLLDVARQRGRRHAIL